MRYIITAAFIAIALASAAPAAAAKPSFATSGGKWTLDGGAAWRERVGPGLYAGLGGAACDDHWCEGDWDSDLFGSLDAMVGFFYRIRPNWVIFFDVSTGLLPASVHGVDNDHGFLFTTVGGFEFHIPVTGWLDTYAGFGIGFAFLRFSGEIDATDTEIKQTLLGVDFELRTGATLYLFSRAPGLGLGPYYQLGLTAWPTYCYDDGDNDECDDVDDDLIDEDDLPFVHQVGIELRYGF
jgi:hypothetical protein